MSITTTVTWADLRNAHAAELDDLRDAYEEIREQATKEYDADALDRTLPDDPALLDDDDKALYVYQQQLAQYEQAAESIQKRTAMLERLEDEYGSSDFEIKMLTGNETMEIETELRMLAQQKDTSLDVVQIKRNALSVDKATVDAPEDLPREKGSPTPSQAPNALTLSLWEQVEQFNNAGTLDFRAEGFGDTAPTPTPITDTSATPTTSDESTEPLGDTDE